MFDHRPAADGTAYIVMEYTWRARAESLLPWRLQAHAANPGHPALCVRPPETLTATHAGAASSTAIPVMIYSASAPAAENHKDGEETMLDSIPGV